MKSVGTGSLFPRGVFRVLEAIITTSNQCSTGFEADAKRAKCQANSVGALYILSSTFETRQKAHPEHHKFQSEIWLTRIMF